MPTLRPRVLALTCLLAVFLVCAPARAQEKGEGKGGDSPVEIMTDPPMVRFRNAPKLDIPVRKPEPPSPRPNWGGGDRPRALSQADAFRAKCHVLDDQAAAMPKALFPKGLDASAMSGLRKSQRAVLSDALFTTSNTVMQVEDLLDWSCSIRKYDASMRERVAELMLRYGVRLAEIYSDILENMQLCEQQRDVECQRISWIMLSRIDVFIGDVFAFSKDVAAGRTGLCATKARPTSKVE